MAITDDASMQRMFCIYQQTRFQVPLIELYVEFEQHTGVDEFDEEVNINEFGDIGWEEDNDDSEEEFEANYEVDDENDDGDLAGNPAVPNEAHAVISQQPFGVPSFMRTLDLEAIHAPEFPEWGNVAAEDGEFSVGMEFGSRESVISAIKSYTMSRGVDYTVYESEPQTFYAKCKGYGAGCDWLIRASLIRKKACWEIRRYNGKHTCTMGTISQDHAKLDSDTIADAIRPLVEADPSIKVKSIIAEVQSKFNYTISYRKAWLAKQKSVAKVFGGWEVSYQTLPIWLKAMTAKMPRSRVQIKTLPVYRESEEVQGVRVLHRVFWSFYPCIVAFRHCKPLVQVDGTHLYGKYKGALLVAVAQDGNQNIVPIAFAIVEGETADAWEFFLSNLRRYVVTIDGVGIISDRHNSIDAAIARSNGAWSPPRAWHMYCIRHIGSNFLRRFKAPYLHKLVVNTGYSRTEQEYNKNYQRLRERAEAYAQWCDEIGVQRWVLAFDGGHRWGHMTTNLVECINSVLKGARNLPVTAIVRAAAHERVRNGFTYSEFATKRVEESFRRAGNIVVNRFDRRNEMFEVREMQDGSIHTVNLAQRHCDCGHFQVERLPCRHVLACCANQRLDWQIYVHDVYKMSEICKVYRGEFVPMGDPSTWAPYEGAKVIANWTLRRATKGRPKSTRYLNEMDSRDMRRPRRCTICGREGDSQSRCPQRAESSSARNQA
ncbi:uncharacterized protein LOC130946197 [Arachis stenosperma]|uniref:uncharacterized protein LOC130946197 n=1 Tax=Arachis stenosperma TaxID=217475 RepID=UPI0025AC3717|nr:uncharacterized protein LOC130946197 [Arachis stenosperma]